MRTLADMSFGHRVALTAIIVLAALFALALYGYLSGGWENQERFGLASAEEPFLLSKFDNHLLELERQAVDNAYREQIEHLIAIWFKDDSGQPARAINGANTARQRYINMQAALDKREAQIRALQR